MMILMGLAIGSIVNGPKLQRMVAAEQVIADCIRQARHSARTSAQPVILTLNKDERTISGLVRLPLWQGNEGWSAGILGRTGNSLIAPDAFGGTLASTPDAAAVAGSGAPTPGDLPNSAPGWVLSRQARLNRGQAGPPSGLWVSLWVKPPIAGSRLGQAPNDVPPRTVVPLLLVGPASGQTGYGTQSASTLGLALFRVDPSPVPVGEPTTMQDGRKGPAIPCWEVVGWIHDGGTGMIEVSSVQQGHRPADLQAAATEAQDVLLTPGQAGTTFGPVVSPDQVDATDIASPCIGGSWMEIGLLFADGRLTLYRDGRRVGTIAATVTSLPQHPGETEQVVLGWMADPLQDPDGVAGSATAGAPVAADDTCIDDVRIARLGSSMIGNLPSGVSFLNPSRIVCHPDGRVEVNGGATNSIKLTSNSGQSADISVSITGFTTSTAASP